MVDPLTAPIFAVTLCLSLVTTGLGLWNLRPAIRVLRSDPRPIGEAVNRGGPIEVEGTAAVARETVPAPLTGTDCLGYVLVVQRWKEGSSSEWVLESRIDVAVPFLVVEGTDSLLVDPNGADLLLERSEGLRLAAEERPPQAVRSRLDEVDEYVPFVSGPKRRLFEHRLDVGGSVHVYGHPRRGSMAVHQDSPASTQNGAPSGERRESSTDTGSASYSTVVGAGDDRDPFVISDSDELGSVVRMALLPGGLVVLGLVASALSLLLLLA